MIVLLEGTVLTPESAISWQFVLAVLVPALAAIVFVRESLVKLRIEVRGLREATEKRLTDVEEAQSASAKGAFSRREMRYWSSALADKNADLKVPEVEL